MICLSIKEEHRTRTVFLGTALAFGLATVASAAVTHPAPVGNANSSVVKVAEGCGPGMWRAPAANAI
jgi:hypothetical protein